MSKDRITPSSMKAMRLCPHLYFMRYVAGIVREQHDTPLYVGTVFHEGQELGKVPDYDPEFPGWMDEEDDQHKYLCDFEKAKAMVRAYIEFWEGAEYEVIKSEMEIPDLPIWNPDSTGQSLTFVKAGKLDKIIDLPGGIHDDLPENVMALCEYKTTSEDISPQSVYWAKLSLDPQLRHYFISALEMGYPVKAIVYDVTVRPGIKPKNISVLDKGGNKQVFDDETGERVFNKQKKKDMAAEPRQTAGKGLTLKTRLETPEEFGQRVYAVMMAEPDAHFIRKPIPMSEADLDEYKFDLWNTTKEIMSRHSAGNWGKNGDACFKWNKPCSYFDLCSTGIEVNQGDDFAPLGYEFKRAHSELAEREGGAEE